MTRTPELAPSYLPRQQRRRINRQLYKLLHRDDCSICGSPLKHNSRTASGLDAQGNVVVAGECCSDQVAISFGIGHYVTRNYDFIARREHPKSAVEPTNEQIVEGIAAYQKFIADTDKQLDNIEQRGGVGRSRNIGLLDRPWKTDDRIWFEQNSKRSHRARLPFPGEADKETARAPAGHTLIVLLRQVEPGSRLKTRFFLNIDLLPMPDDEAVAHTLFELAVGREAVPPDWQALFTLIEKYTVQP